MNRSNQSRRGRGSAVRFSPPVLLLRLMALLLVPSLPACQRKTTSPSASPPAPVRTDNGKVSAARPEAGTTPVAGASSVPIPGRDADRFSGFLAPILDRVEVASDVGWDSEVFADAATAQLKKLANVLGQSGATESALGDLLASDCTAGQLRPKSLRTVFEDATSVVREKDASTSSSPQSAAFRGRRGVAAALDELRKPLREAQDTRVSFKLFRVEQTGDRVATQCYFQASGRGPRGVVQQNATWSIGWEVGPGPPKIRSLAVTDYVEILPGTGGGLAFRDVTQSVLGSTASFQRQLLRGVDYWRGRLEANYGVDINGNQGIAVGDVNGDGLDDIYVCQQGGLPNRLYVQEPDGTLRDRSAAAGVDWMEVCRSALFVDLDNDGDQDLVMAQGWHLMIMMNDGSGKFTVALEKSSQGNLFSTAAADYDNDGDLDLFFCGRNPFREQTREEGILGTPIPYHDANNAGPNMLLRNDGPGKFTEVTKEVGLDVNNRRYSYAASWEDYDNDGDMDLYVANDFGRNNLYRNDIDEHGQHRFTDIAAQAGVEDISAGMSVTWGDYNNDGRMDPYISNMFSSAGNRIAYQRQFRSDKPSDQLRHFRRHARGNTLFANMGGRGFDDVSLETGVTMGRWAWGAKYCDLNNDGWEDLYVANGFITTNDSGDL